MKILFSPSESKQKGGTDAPFHKQSFLFPECFQYRKKMIDLYHDVINNADINTLSKLFGIKDKKMIDYYRANLYTQKTRKAIERYDGVAFQYLDYASLNATSKDYLDHNTIIFSNLFGPILAGDRGLPDYKLKQGEKLGALRLEQFYKEHLTPALDDFLKDEEILDLRAGFYEKFYKIKQPFLSLKFIKNGKVVSHWAKAYRGIVLRMLALKNIDTVDALMHMDIDGLHIYEIKKQGLRTEVCYQIT
ncbi:YaaA family protein [Sulfurospirillum sp. 1612]|uniref:YaaA family protein n=1 Tax=Sulfurospirillum sp. 1612 TaxID=3094835 RepID=UPI002F92078D